MERELQRFGADGIDAGNGQELVLGCTCHTADRSEAAETCSCHTDGHTGNGAKHRFGNPFFGALQELRVARPVPWDPEALRPRREQAKPESGVGGIGRPNEHDPLVESGEADPAHRSRAQVAGVDVATLDEQKPYPGHAPERSDLPPEPPCRTEP